MCVYIYIYIYISKLTYYWDPLRIFLHCDTFTTIIFYLLNLCNVLQLSHEGVLLFVFMVQVFGGSVWPLRR